MTQHQLIDRMAKAFERDDRIEALFLSGSFGRGTADAYSDVDFVAIAPAEFHDDIADAWRSAIETFEEIVYWNRIDARTVLLNAVTGSYLRCDLLLTDKRGLRYHAQAFLEVVRDPGGLFDKLPKEPATPKPDPKRIEWIINEVIRILGLSPVGLGRGEYIGSVTGAGLMRSYLIDLILARSGGEAQAGALRLNHRLSAGQRKILENLPVPAPNRESILASNQAYYKAFRPIAKALADELGIPWPEAFEAAMKKHVKQELGVEL